MAKIGQQQYYKQSSSGSYHGHKKKYDYQALDWTGNVPHGLTPISKEEYTKGITEMAGWGMPSYKKQLTQVRDESIAKGYQKYQSDAPTTSEQYYTEEYKAKLAKEREGMVNIGTADRPMYVPAGSPAEQLQAKAGQTTAPSVEPTQSTTPQLTPVGRFPGSSDELESWREQGYKYDKGEWFMPVGERVAPLKDTNGGRIKEIAEQLSGIKTRAEKIQQEIEKRKDLAVIRRNKEIETEEKTGSSLLNEGQVSFDWQSEVDAKANPQGAIDAVDKIGGDTLDLAVSQDIPPSLQIPDYIKEGKAEAEETIQQMLANLENDTFSREDKMREEFEAWGIEETFEALKSIQQQAVSARKNLSLLEAQEQAALDRVSGVGMNMSFLRSEQNAIKNEYGRKKATASAELAGFQVESQMLQNNIALATNFASRLVDAACYDAERELNKWELNLDIAYDLKDSLTAAEMEIFQINYDQAEMRFKEAKEEREQIMKWATDKTYAPAFYGVDLSDIGIDEAVEKINNYLSNRAKIQQENLLSPSECATLGVPYGTTEEEAQEMGIVPARWKPTETEEAGEWDKDDIGEFIRKGIDAGKGWAVLASELEANGVPIYQGSLADQMLNDFFGGGSGVGGGSGGNNRDLYYSF